MHGTHLCFSLTEMSHFIGLNIARDCHIQLYFHVRLVGFTSFFGNMADTSFTYLAFHIMKCINHVSYEFLFKLDVLLFKITFKLQLLPFE